MIKRLLYFFLIGLGLSLTARAQTITDSAGNRVETGSVREKTVDSAGGSISPKQAAIRSAIIPGWGQVSVRKDMKASLFRKYYSLPIIYGGIGTSIGVFAYNITWYRRTRFAYKALVTNDTASFSKVDPKLQYFIATNNASSLQRYRNQFRQDVDYSALFVLLLWGLNVVHASVEAHLKTFDVSSDIGLRIRGGHSELAGTNGLSLVLTFK